MGFERGLLLDFIKLINEENDFSEFLDKKVAKQNSKSRGKRKNRVILGGDFNNIFPGENKKIINILQDRGFLPFFALNEGTYGKENQYHHDIIAPSSKEDTFVEKYSIKDFDSSDHRRVEMELLCKAADYS